jgi:NAD-dependent deacetylase
MQNIKSKTSKAAKILRNSKATTAFTGAGISVESGIPTFRGKEGLWSKYDPKILDINYFHNYPKDSRKVIKEIFYDFFGKATFNKAHEILALMEQNKLIDNVITQNIDNLHQEAGSKVVHEFHGNSKNLICTNCGKSYNIKEVSLSSLPPKCSECDGLLKPDFIFFGEGIPQKAYSASLEAAEKSEVFLVIGTTGEVMPACQIPYLAKQNGATIIEVNPEESNFTNKITDVFLKGKASEIMNMIEKELFKNK